MAELVTDARLRDIKAWADGNASGYVAPEARRWWEDLVTICAELAAFREAAAQQREMLHR